MSKEGDGGTVNQTSFANLACNAAIEIEAILQDIAIEPVALEKLIKELKIAFPKLIPSSVPDSPAPS